MKTVANFVINPCEFHRPAFRISPFQTADVARNARYPHNTQIDNYFAARFPGRELVYTSSGREAIGLALSSLKLKRDDCVTILTTTGNHYISGCVTNEVEKFCRWSRSIEASTKVLFVNHEFGFAYENLVKLKRHGFVLIEDICHSFVSNNREGSVGQVGDFVVASFPKYFPVQCGGLLAYRPDRRVSEILDSATKRYCQSVLSHYQDQIEIIAQQKRANHEYLAGLFGERGMSARFVLKPNDVPGVFMFKVPAQTNLVAMKVFMARNGIQGGGFHKENAYFVPVHQNLSEYDMRYICEVATDYLSEKGDL